MKLQVHQYIIAYKYCPVLRAPNEQVTAANKQPDYAFNGNLQVALNKAESGLVRTLSKQIDECDRLEIRSRTVAATSYCTLLPLVFTK